MSYNEKYSYQDYTNYDYSESDLTDANGTTIIGTCFYQEGFPFVDMAALGLSNITFKNCNLDNIIVPQNCTMINCQNRYIRPNPEDEYNDWICDENGNFLEVLNG